MNRWKKQFDFSKISLFWKPGLCSPHLVFSSTWQTLMTDLFLEQLLFIFYCGFFKKRFKQMEFQECLPKFKGKTSICRENLKIWKSNGVQLQKKWYLWHGVNFFWKISIKTWCDSHTLSRLGTNFTSWNSIYFLFGPDTDHKNKISL